MKALENIEQLQLEAIQDRDEYTRQVAALKAAIVVKASDVRITDCFGEGRCIHLELNGD